MMQAIVEFLGPFSWGFISQRMAQKNATPQKLAIAFFIICQLSLFGIDLAFAHVTLAGICDNALMSTLGAVFFYIIFHLEKKYRTRKPKS